MKMNNLSSPLISAILSFTLLIPLNTVQASEEIINVYSARKEQLIKPLFDAFTQQSGIKINLVTSKGDALLKRLEVEGIKSPADILITTDVGRLYRAKEAGGLQPAITDALQKQLPVNLRDPERYWLALTTRARVIVYAHDRVNPSELSTYENLTDPKWKNRICIRSSNNIYNQSLVSSMIANKGAQATQDWANGLVNNFARKPKGGDRDQIKAVAAGQCDLAVVNTYYLGQMLNSADDTETGPAKKVSVFWPNQADRGTHINVSGVAMTKSSKNKQNGLKLMAFLLSKESQNWYANTNNEYPVIAGGLVSDTLNNWGTFKSDALNLSELGKHNMEAVRIMDRAGWR